MTLLEKLGAGPSGVVYRALHQGKSCAVKLPCERPVPEGTERRERFERDILALARLRRFGLPHVLQLGETEQTTYAVLAEAPGESLSLFLMHKRRHTEILFVMRKLVTAVQQLHAAGFVHGSLTLHSIQVRGQSQDVMLADRGTINRPHPFDPRADLRALSSTLKTCLACFPPTDSSLTRLRQKVCELAHDGCEDCSEVVAELELLTLARRGRGLRYPQLPMLDPLETVIADLGARSELAQVLRARRRACVQRGKLVQVLGSAGSGKSRLLQMFSQEVACEALVLAVRCRDSDWAPFSALKRLLEGHVASLSQLDSDERQVLEHAMRAAAGPMAAAIGLLSPQLAELLGEVQVEMAEGDVQRVFIESLADFLARYLESTASSVVVIDDVHWLDASSRMVLSSVAARVCGGGHLFVCGARDDAESRERLSRFHESLSPELVETISLGALSRDDSARIIADYLGLGMEAEPCAELVAELAQLSDGTPLGLLELLRVTLDRGYLRPYQEGWHLDTEGVRHMDLPRNTRALIERRLQELPEGNLTILRAAAVIRGHVDKTLLADVTSSTPEQVKAALAHAVEARLLARNKNGEYAFVHDSVWEGLLRDVPSAEQRALHQRVVESLYREGGSGAQYEYELARHHAGGELARQPKLAFEATLRAGMRAFEACDDVLAISFFRTAKAAARLAGIQLDHELYVRFAESSLRQGATRQSLVSFRRALARSAEDYQRAHVLGRMAWIHHFESNSQQCMRTLQAALAELGRGLPAEEPAVLARSLLCAVVGDLPMLGLPTPRAPVLSPRHADTLCTLYIECTRVEVENGNPLRGIAAGLQLALAARSLAPSRTAVHAQLLLAFMLSTLGVDKLWRRRLSRAQTMARELADPVAQALCHQFQYMITAWRGDIDECERQALECVVERGHFLELSDLCGICYGMYAIEQLRGRPQAAWTWLERAIDRVCSLGQASAAFSIVEEAAHLTLKSLGRGKQSEQLAKRLRSVRRADLRQTGFFHLVSFQSRVQALTERGELGDELEALVAEFERFGMSSRRVHLAVLPYYVHVAHARVNQCLRATAASRSALLPKLERALRDLEAGDRVALISAHVHVVRAARSFFRGRTAEAQRSLDRADKLAQEQRCMWVSYAAARLRAHLLRAEGDECAAVDQARIAALWAEQAGQLSRLQCIREEFPGAVSVRPRVSPEADGVPSRSNLRSLLLIGQANSRELRPERQAQLILGEVIEALGAERAFLFTREEASTALVLRAARNAAGDVLGADARCDRELIQRVYVTGQAKICHALVPSRATPQVDRACIVAPLVVREQQVGVLYLDRAEAVGDFTDEDATLLQALANQVPVAIELANALRARERLQNNLRRSHEMEAVGRLAGGVAHDFNDILDTIRLRATELSDEAAGTQRCDLEDILTSTERGAELTRQLLTFASGGKTPPRMVALGGLVDKLSPMLQRLTPDHIHLTVEVDRSPLWILADPSQVERVLTNLCCNANDAMPSGGTLKIVVQPLASSSTTSLSGELRPDTAYAELTVIDSGTGMSEEVRARLFEPFFTTKERGRGTGLGLSNVYAIVQQCAGHIEVASEPGVGTTFRIYLPLAVVHDDEQLQHGQRPMLDA